MSDNKFEKLNFAASVLSGKALESDINDYIDEWHDGDSTLELHEYLGLTNDEFSLYVEQPRSLSFIFNSRVYNRDISNLLKDNEVHKIAARSLRDDESEGLVTWLQSKGYINSD